MSVGAFRLRSDDGPRFRLRDLFTPLETLLASGGDSRLALDPGDRLNAYGCTPQPQPDVWNFASSTASSISDAAYDRAALAREELMHKSLFDEVEVAFDARIEDMRDELRGLLQLSPRVDVVFAASGTDAQLYTLHLARAMLGKPPVTIVVGSDQTGSGTSFTARGRHFSSVTASGVSVRKDGPVAGLAGDSIAIPLLDAASGLPCSDVDAAVLGAIEATIMGRRPVLLQIMDSSKLGWRAPSEACLDEIVARWPGKVQIVVDACQMRLGRRRLRFYLDRGFMVLISGSKFFGGPAFSGALLTPKGLSRAIERDCKIAPGFLDYASRSDWPKGWGVLRSSFPNRPNFGQWLRWEAALAEMSSYYALPGAFRASALAELKVGITNMIALTPGLEAVRSATGTMSVDDEEFVHDTIFPVTLKRNGRPVSIADTSAVYRGLARDMTDVMTGSPSDRQVAAQRALVGQPVRFAQEHGTQSSLLRLCVGARLVTESWSADKTQAQLNLQHVLDRIAHVIVKIELLLGRDDGSTLPSGA